MPLAKPKKSDQDKQSFISRCMSDEKTKKEFPDQKQHLAYCYSTWDNRNKAKAEIVNNSIEITFPQVELEDESS